MHIFATKTKILDKDCVSSSLCSGVCRASLNVRYLQICMHISDFFHESFHWQNNPVRIPVRMDLTCKRLKRSHPKFRINFLPLMDKAGNRKNVSGRTVISPNNPHMPDLAVGASCRHRFHCVISTRCKLNVDFLTTTQPSAKSISVLCAMRPDVMNSTQTRRTANWDSLHVRTTRKKKAGAWKGTGRAVLCDFRPVVS